MNRLRDEENIDFAGYVEDEEFPDDSLMQFAALSVQRVFRGSEGRKRYARIQLNAERDKIKARNSHRKKVVNSNEPKVASSINAETEVPIVYKAVKKSKIVVQSLRSPKAPYQLEKAYFNDTGSSSKTGSESASAHPTGELIPPIKFPMESEEQDMLEDSLRINKKSHNSPKLRNVKANKVSNSLMADSLEFSKSETKFNNNKSNRDGDDLNDSLDRISYYNNNSNNNYSNPNFQVDNEVVNVADSLEAIKLPHKNKNKIRDEAVDAVVDEEEVWQCEVCGYRKNRNTTITCIMCESSQNEASTLYSSNAKHKIDRFSNDSYEDNKPTSVAVDPHYKSENIPSRYRNKFNVDGSAVSHLKPNKSMGATPASVTNNNKITVAPTQQKYAVGLSVLSEDDNEPPEQFNQHPSDNIAIDDDGADFIESEVTVPRHIHMQAIASAPNVLQSKLPKRSVKHNKQSNNEVNNNGVPKLLEGLQRVDVPRGGASSSKKHIAHRRHHAAVVIQSTIRRYLAHKVVQRKRQTIIENKAYKCVTCGKIDKNPNNRQCKVCGRIKPTASGVAAVAVGVSMGEKQQKHVGVKDLMAKEGDAQQRPSMQSNQTYQQQVQEYQQQWRNNNNNNNINNNNVNYGNNQVRSNSYEEQQRQPDNTKGWNNEPPRQQHLQQQFNQPMQYQQANQVSEQQSFRQLQMIQEQQRRQHQQQLDYEQRQQEFQRQQQQQPAPMVQQTSQQQYQQNSNQQPSQQQQQPPQRKGEGYFSAYQQQASQPTVASSRPTAVNKNVAAASPSPVMKPTPPPVSNSKQPQQASNRAAAVNNNNNNVKSRISSQEEQLLAEIQRLTEVQKVKNLDRQIAEAMAAVGPTNNNINNNNNVNKESEKRIKKKDKDDAELLRDRERLAFKAGAKDVKQQELPARPQRKKVVAAQASSAIEKNVNDWKNAAAGQPTAPMVNNLVGVNYNNVSVVNQQQQARNMNNEANSVLRGGQNGYLQEFNRKIEAPARKQRGSGIRGVDGTDNDSYYSGASQQRDARSDGRAVYQQQQQQQPQYSHYLEETSSLPAILSARQMRGGAAVPNVSSNNNSNYNGGYQHPLDSQRAHVKSRNSTMSAPPRLRDDTQDRLVLPEIAPQQQLQQQQQYYGGHAPMLGVPLANKKSAKR